jgi:hypothetical protein
MKAMQEQSTNHQVATLDNIMAQPYLEPVKVANPIYGMNFAP